MAITDLIPWKRDEKQVPIRREAEDSLVDLQGEMNRLFEDFWRDPFSLSPFNIDRWPTAWSRAGFNPQVDVRDTEKAYVLSAELPGMDSDDVEISLGDNVLTIKGEKRSEREEKDKDYYYAERSYGSFRREFPLPNEVDEDQIEASFKKGVLTITMPKLPEIVEQRKRIPIKIGKG